jgi:hypothetical protein
MPYLMSKDIPQKLTHEVFREGEASGSGIRRRCLGEVPGEQKLLDVLIKLDVGVQDLSGTGVMDVGT